MSRQEGGNLCRVSSLSSGGIVILPLVRSQDLADQLVIKAGHDILRRGAAQEEQGRDPIGRSGYPVEVIIEDRPQEELGSSRHQIVKHRCVF